MLRHDRHMLASPVIPIPSNVCRLVATIHPLVMHIRVVEIEEHDYDYPSIDKSIPERLAV